MKISFEFNDGETATQIVSAIVSLFGASAGVVSQGSPTGVAGNAPATLTPPAGDAEEAGSAADPRTIDANGVPHDSRIHSDPPVMTTKNVWRKKRGVADTLVASVTAELKARAGSVAQPPAATTPPPLSAPGALTPPPAAAPLAPPPLVEDNYTKFVKFLSAHMAPAGRLTSDYVNNYLAQIGYKDAQGNGSIQVVQTATPEAVAQLAATFAQALGVASPV